MTRTAPLATSSLALGAALLAGVAGSALLVQHRSEQNLAAELAKAHISFAHLSLNLLSGVTDLQDVDIHADGGNAHIGHIKLSGSPLALITSAQAGSGEEIKFQDVSGTFGLYDIDIPNLTVTGSNLSQSVLESMFDPQATGTLAERVSKLNAAAITADEVTLTSTFGEISTETTYTNLKTGAIADGKISSVTIDSAETSMDSNDPLDISSTMGAITASSINLPGIIRLATETAKGDEPLVPLVDALTAKDMEIDIADDKDQGFAVKIASAGYDHFKGRPLKTAFADIMRMASAQKQQQPPKPEDLAIILAGLADIYQAIEGNITVKGIEFAPMNGIPGPKGKLDSISMLDFGKGGIGSIGYEGLSIEADKGHANLGAFTLKGLSFAPFLTAVSEAAKQNFKDFNPRASLPSLAQIALSGLDFDVPDDKNEGNSGNGSRNKASLGKFEINLSNYINGIPANISASVDHVALDLPKDSKDKDLKPLLELGVTRLDLSAKLEMSYAEPTQEIALKELSASGTDLGKLTLAGTIGNVSKDIFNTDTNIATAAALAAVVKNLDVKLENAGILDKIIAVQAKAQGKSADAFKKELIAMASFGVPALLGGDGATGKVVANALSKFIADPKRLHVSATSKSGLGAGDIGLIQNPADLLKKVDISAGANE